MKLTASAADSSAGVRSDERRYPSATVQTTDATVTTIQTIQVEANNLVVHVEADVAAFKSSTGVAATYRLLACFKRVAGVTTMVASSLTSLEDAAAATWTVTTTNSGTSIVIQVTGIIGDTVDWKCWVSSWAKA